MKDLVETNLTRSQNFNRSKKMKSLINHSWHWLISWVCLEKCKEKSNSTKCLLKKLQIRVINRTIRSNKKFQDKRIKFPIKPIKKLLVLNPNSALKIHSEITSNQVPSLFLVIIINQLFRPYNKLAVIKHLLLKH